MVPDITSFKIPLKQLREELFEEKNVSVWVARLDEIHPIASGNKLYKLHFFMKAVAETSHKTLLTFGGPYSNHLVATAWMAKEQGLHSIGIIRGENHQIPSPTLIQCMDYGMRLDFFSRKEYEKSRENVPADHLFERYGSHFVIPEGGYHPMGVKGAALIMENLKPINATHICTAVGTATTLTGLLEGSLKEQKIIGIPVLKGMEDIPKRIQYLSNSTEGKMAELWLNYHFGGYARKTEELISFMNEVYEKYGLPTDFVYTAKMLYAVVDKIKDNYFPPGSVIICLHTGGLQGNNSLPKGTLLF